MRKTTGGLFKRGNIFWARWQYNGRTSQQSTGETTERKARAKLAVMTAPYKLQNESETFRTLAERSNLSQAAANALLKSNLSLDGVWAAFVASEGRGRARAGTLRQYEIQWGRFVAWLQVAFPDVVTIAAVNHEHAAAFIRSLSTTRTANTVNKYRGLLAMIWDRLKSDERITVDNPWEKIARREQRDEGRRELTVNELRRVCKKAKGDLRTLIAVGIYTGLRMGDAATLRWAEIDLVRSIIRRVPSKSRKGRLLTIPIHPVLRGILEDAPPKRHGEFVMPKIAHDYERSRTYVTNRVQELFKACKIKTLRVRKGPGARKIIEAGFHSLRHAFVSMCAESNVPLSVVQGLIGHTTAGMTEKYFHLSAGAATAAIASLPAFTGKIVKRLALPAPAPPADELVTLAGKIVAGTATEEDKARFRLLAAKV